MSKKSGESTEKCNEKLIELPTYAMMPEIRGNWKEYSSSKRKYMTNIPGKYPKRNMAVIL